MKSFVDEQTYVDTDNNRKNFENTPKIRQKSKKIGKIPEKSPKFAKNRRFSVIFTLKLKNFCACVANFFGVLVQKSNLPYNIFEATRDINLSF